MRIATPQVILVVPCYNEEKRLPGAEIDAFVRQEEGRLKIMLINDGSSDATGRVITALAAANPDIIAINRSDNIGKAETVRDGIMAAVREPCEWVGFWDADMATPLNELSHLLAHCRRRDYEVVTGCRLARLGADVRRKLTRHYLGRVFATVASTLLHLPLYDSQCGAKIFRRELAEQIFARPFVSRWLFDVEIFRRLVQWYGKEKTTRIVYECPLYQWIDVAGSKLTPARILETPWELWKIFRAPAFHPAKDRSGTGKTDV
ncbi:MAG: glycosyltransferase [Victivallales bacterium]|nr:glycosyltransferase [Victivallales bacterium]